MIKSKVLPAGRTNVKKRTFDKDTSKQSYPLFQQIQRSGEDYIYVAALPGNGCCSPSNVITVASCIYKCLSLVLRSIQIDTKYPLLNGDWNMGAACLSNHLMSTCQRYLGGTKSKTTGLSNQKHHGEQISQGSAGNEKNQLRFWQGFYLAPLMSPN